MPCPPAINPTYNTFLPVASSAMYPTGVDLRAGLGIYNLATSQFLLYDGTGWVVMAEPNQSWVPTIAGITVGSGVKTGTYKRSDGWIDIVGSFTLGAGSAVTGDLVVTLPIASSATYFYSPLFNAYALGIGAEYPMMIGGATTAQFAIRAINAAGTYAVQTVVTATIPFTWAATHAIWFSGRYPMTTRYS